MICLIRFRSGESRTIGERKAEKTWGVAAAPKKKYLAPMTNTKNLLIAILTGLLALSLFTQPAQSATAKSAPVTLTQSDLITIAKSVPYVSSQDQAKLIEYNQCFSYYLSRSANAAFTSVDWTDRTIVNCSKYKP